MKLLDKTAVITGGATGIGLATARRLLHEGCKVTIWDIDPPSLDKALAELSPSGKVFGYACDVTDKDRVYQLAGQAAADMGRVDILVNNAGIVYGGMFLEQDDEKWEKTIQVNLTALMYTTRAFLPGMYERDSGHIVNLSSASGMIGVPGLAVYSATKWAVWGFTESLRMEAHLLGRKGVRYSSVHPSYIRTGLFAGAKLGFPGSLIVPLVKNHDVIAKAIVVACLQKGRYSPRRPWTVGLTLRLRGALPDSWFQRLLILLGIPQGMLTWRGHKGKP
jgi:all-trans-retinol dehydrogenase (NAD+)